MTNRPPRPATTTAPLTIGPRDMPHTVPAGSVVTVIGSPQAPTVYISHCCFGGSVDSRYLQFD